MFCLFSFPALSSNLLLSLSYSVYFVLIFQRYLVFSHGCYSSIQRHHSSVLKRFWDMTPEALLLESMDETLLGLMDAISSGLLLDVIPTVI